MSYVILFWGTFIAQLMLAIALLPATFRLVWGPRAQDRVIGFDTLYITVMMLFITFDIRAGTTLHFEAALIIGMLGFVSSIAISKFLMRGEVIE